MLNKKILATALLTGMLGAGAWAMAPTAANAETVQHRCDAYGCWNVRCDDDGDYCQRVWDNDSYYHRHYYTGSSYYRSNGYYDGDRWVPYDRDTRRVWQCDSDGDDCHWTIRSY